MWPFAFHLRSDEVGMSSVGAGGRGRRNSHDDGGSGEEGFKNAHLISLQVTKSK